MIIIMWLFIFLVFFEPGDSIFLGRELNRIEIYNNNIYCAPFIGKSIFILDESKKLTPTTFTDDENYRIYDFRITPFAIYLNNGNAIEKFYFASGKKERIYSSSYISSFVITSSEEVILSDRQRRKLIFLDFINRVKFIIDDLIIKDLYLTDDVIYILTQNSILFCDEYGNLFEEKKIPEKFGRFFVHNKKVIIFSSEKKYLYILNTDWQKIELTHGLRDIVANNDFFVMLDENGTTLYFYSISDF